VCYRHEFLILFDLWLAESLDANGYGGFTVFLLGYSVSLPRAGSPPPSCFIKMAPQLASHRPQVGTVAFASVTAWQSTSLSYQSQAPGALGKGALVQSPRDPLTWAVSMAPLHTAYT
jgi:hypothetical protein